VQEPQFLDSLSEIEEQVLPFPLRLLPPSSVATYAAASR
jgi:hypothetical protein